MRIVIFGSWKLEQKDNWRLFGKEVQFHKACQELGEKLVQEGHTIIAGSTCERTADYHFIQGALNAFSVLKLDNHVVEIFRPNNIEQPYKELAKEHPNAFKYHDFPSGRWPISHLLSLLESDSVIVVGGASYSYNACLAGLVAKKPIIPVSSFGGASLKISKEVENRFHTLYKNNKDLVGKLRTPWSEQHVKYVLDILSQLNSTKILLIHGRSNDWLLVKDFVEKQLSIETIVMKEVFSQGRSLPEKFEQLAFPVRGAIVIATPDDLGKAAIDSNGVLIEKNNIELSSRARQNIWLEYGWIWGALGRDRILLITKRDVEVPSDLKGIEFYNYRNNPNEIFESIRQFIKQIEINKAI